MGDDTSRKRVGFVASCLFIKIPQCLFMRVLALNHTPTVFLQRFRSEVVACISIISATAAVVYSTTAYHSKPRVLRIEDLCRELSRRFASALAEIENTVFKRLFMVFMQVACRSAQVFLAHLGKFLLHSCIAAGEGCAFSC